MEWYVALRIRMVAIIILEALLLESDCVIKTNAFYKAQYQLWCQVPGNKIMSVSIEE
jgi:hypothetical protein